MEISNKPQKMQVTETSLKKCNKKEGIKSNECETCHKIFSSKQYLEKHKFKAHAKQSNTPEYESVPIKIEVDPDIYSGIAGIKSEQSDDTLSLKDETASVKIEVTPTLYPEDEESDQLENPIPLIPIVEYSGGVSIHDNVEEFDFTVDNDRMNDEKVNTDVKEKLKQGPKVWIPGDGEKGVPCTECGKFFKSKGPMFRHFEDMHRSGVFPCKGCGKVFTSKNKMSSHFSRNCKRADQNPVRIAQLIEGNEEIKEVRDLDLEVKNDYANFEFEEFNQYRNKLFGS